ncbi:uncharacterized protein LOC106130060 [Amyelois transitella]|uniref:uncharacterized protein LOC106130060 n=1 Tax=Amyelois transitella TaxID=680683 RepID=UPI00067B80DB|nr:uncharacterized protein LOC106130060 [Amyelois transitella]
MSQRKVRSRRNKSPPKKSVQPNCLTLMTPKTRDFIQKICYKKAASVDMTTNGFITESRMGPINVYVKPLRDQIHKIVEAANSSQDKTFFPRKRGGVKNPAIRKKQFTMKPSLNICTTAKLQKKSVVFSE